MSVTHEHVLVLKEAVVMAVFVTLELTLVEVTLVGDKADRLMSTGLS